MVKKSKQVEKKSKSILEFLSNQSTQIAEKKYNEMPRLEKIVELSKCGVVESTIAKILGIPFQEMYLYEEQMLLGRTLANRHVADMAYQMAMAGDREMIKFWLKTRAGFRELDKVPEKSVQQSVLEVLQQLKNQTISESRTRLEVITDVEG